MPPILIKFVLPQVARFGAQRFDEHRRRQRENKWREAAERCEREHPMTVIEKSSGRRSLAWAVVSLCLGTSIGLALSQVDTIQSHLQQLRQKYM